MTPTSRLEPDTLSALKVVSAQIGSDTLMTQGAGGNSSLKYDNVLWVKASGCWMKHALTKDIFVPLDLGIIRRHLYEGTVDSFAQARLDHPSTQNLRPSIETSLHALMPHRVILHVHPINSVCLSVLKDGGERFLSALQPDFKAIVLPYCQPGLPLASLLEAHIQSGNNFDVVLLQNHGLIIGAESPEAARQLLYGVEQRIELKARPKNDSPSLKPPISVCDYERIDELSFAAFEQDVMALLSNYVLVPDQVVFLGGTLVCIEADEPFEQGRLRLENQVGRKLNLIMWAGHGLYSRKPLSQGTGLMLKALFDIAMRLPKNADVKSLDATHIAMLLSWEAEAYRKSLDTERAHFI